MQGWKEEKQSSSGVEGKKKHEEVFLLYQQQKEKYEELQSDMNSSDAVEKAVWKSFVIVRSALKYLRKNS